MKIKSIKIYQKGFKGLEIKYLQEEQKNGHPFINEIIEKRKHPIHLSLQTLFADLRFHLLDITGGLSGDEDKEIKDRIIHETEITGIEFDPTQFSISGERVVFLDKKFKLKTPKVDDGDHYDHFETVQSMIEQIVEETVEYLNGTKKVDDVEVAIRWIESGGNKDITPEMLRALTPEQLKKFATEVLESSFGSVVLSNDSYEPNEADVQANVESALTEIKADEETVVIAIDSKPKKEKKKKGIDTITEGFTKECVPTAEPVVLSSSNETPAF